MLLILLIIIGIWYYKKQEKTYQESSYYKITHNSYLNIYFDKGKFGEYQIYKKLRGFEAGGCKFLFNLYIPRENGETTEIDVLMIVRRGLIVFESKNYSGWIFGNEYSQKWTQTLPAGRRARKFYFFNPILQNKGHINNLKKLLNESIPMFSIITFSERCTLKKVPTNTRELKIINRGNVMSALKSIADNSPEVMDEAKINEIYDKLYPYIQVSESIKFQHIQQIKNR